MTNLGRIAIDCRSVRQILLGYDNLFFLEPFGIEVDDAPLLRSLPWDKLIPDKNLETAVSNELSGQVPPLPSLQMLALAYPALEICPNRFMRFVTAVLFAVTLHAIAKVKATFS